MAPQLAGCTGTTESKMMLSISVLLPDTNVSLTVYEYS